MADMGHYDFITISIFGEMITKPISDLHHYTLSFTKSLSLMKTIIISKFYLWINLCINLWITMHLVKRNYEIAIFICVKNEGIRGIFYGFG